MYIHKIPKILPDKWAQTSVVILLQHPHNLKVQKPNLTTSPDSMHCEQRASHILESHLSVSDSGCRPQRAVVERRVKPRSSDALPARVWGVDVNGQPFSFDCHLDNMSASGVYLRMPRHMKFSSAISLVVRLLSGPFGGMSAAIKGTVIRAESWADGHSGVGIRIVEHRFI